MSENEEKYEAIELVVRVRPDGESWFDVISDVISANCEPILDENGEEVGCTCGLETMGGCEGTLDQCYEHLRTSENWATVKTEDLKRILSITADHLEDDDREAFERLRKEAYWHDEFDAWLASLPEDDDESISTQTQSDD